MPAGMTRVLKIIQQRKPGTNSMNFESSILTIQSGFFKDHQAGPSDLQLADPNILFSPRTDANLNESIIHIDEPSSPPQQTA
eukprot:1149571-Pelagomonas_calceolata.AAC.2